eukprot:10596623-Alexandrium_andersonii.AAC.1
MSRTSAPYSLETLRATLFVLRRAILSTPPAPLAPPGTRSWSTTAARPETCCTTGWRPDLAK